MNETHTNSRTLFKLHQTPHQYYTVAYPFAFIYVPKHYPAPITPPHLVSYLLFIVLHRLSLAIKLMHRDVFPTRHCHSLPACVG